MVNLIRTIYAKSYNCFHFQLMRKVGKRGKCWRSQRRKETTATGPLLRHQNAEITVEARGVSSHRRFELHQSIIVSLVAVAASGGGVGASPAFLA